MKVNMSNTNLLMIKFTCMAAVQLYIVVVPVSLTLKS